MQEAHSSNGMKLKDEFVITKGIEKSKNIIEVFNFEDNFLYENQKVNYFTMELCKTDLFDLLRGNPGGMEIPLTRAIFKQLVTSVAHIHKNNVYHRDLKLDNCFVGFDGYLKLGDFGLAQKVPNKEQSFFDDNRGTKEYKAPEITRRLINSLYDGEKADVFALGVLLFFLIFKERPFELANNDDRHYARIMQGRPELFWSSFKQKLARMEDHDKQEVQFIIMKMIAHDPAARFTINDILQSDFLNNPDQLTEEGLVEYFNAL